MLGPNAKINGARAKRRPAFCSAGLSAQHLRLERRCKSFTRAPISRAPCRKNRPTKRNGRFAKCFG